MLPWPVGLFKLMLNVFLRINTQGRELCSGDAIGFRSVSYQPISFQTLYDGGND